MATCKRSVFFWWKHAPWNYSFNSFIFLIISFETISNFCNVNFLIVCSIKWQSILPFSFTGKDIIVKNSMNCHNSALTRCHKLTHLSAVSAVDMRTSVFSRRFCWSSVVCRRIPWRFHYLLHWWTDPVSLLHGGNSFCRHLSPLRFIILPNSVMGFLLIILLQKILPFLIHFLQGMHLRYPYFRYFASYWYRLLFEISYLASISSRSWRLFASSRSSSSSGAIIW